MAAAATTTTSVDSTRESSWHKLGITGSVGEYDPKVDYESIHRLYATSKFEYKGTLTGAYFSMVPTYVKATWSDSTASGLGKTLKIGAALIGGAGQILTSPLALVITKPVDWADVKVHNSSIGDKPCCCASCISNDWELFGKIISDAKARGVIESSLKVMRLCDNLFKRERRLPYDVDKRFAMLSTPDSPRTQFSEG
jgi:hypothetical protein